MSHQCLPKFELKDGAHYAGHCRNARVALWDAQNNLFWYIRTKFTERFLESIRHPEDDNGFDLFIPEVETVPTDDQRVSLEVARKYQNDLNESRERWVKEQAIKGKRS